MTVPTPPAAPPAATSGPNSRASAIAFLRSRSADAVPHRQGTLFDHLIGTERLLRRWGCAEELCLAGLCHAAYGTDGFAPSLVPWRGRGIMVTALGEVGATVEAMVYVYASCDRSELYPQLAGAGPVTLRDRFLDVTVEASEFQLRDFVDLTLANELEIATTAADRDSTGSGLASWIGPLVEQMQRRASAGARRGAQALLDGSGEG